MHVAERIQHDTLILMISGRVTFYSRKVFQALVKTAKFSSAKHVIFNLEGVTFLDSVGLGALVLLAKKFLKLKGRMIIVNPQDPVKTLLSEMHMEKIIPMYTTDPEFSTFSVL